MRTRILAAISAVGGMAFGSVLIPAVASHAATDAQWDQVAYWESGGRWHLPYGTYDSTGGLQIRDVTWNDFGGRQFAPHAYQATKEQQIWIAEKILRRQGSGAWTTATAHGLVMHYTARPFPGTGHVVFAAPLPAPVHVKQQEPVVVSAGSVTVTVGHWPDADGSLFGIAKQKYGNGDDWPRIYQANKGVIGSDPNLVQPGTVLVIPR